MLLDDGLAYQILNREGNERKFYPQTAKAMLFGSFRINAFRIKALTVKIRYFFTCVDITNQLLTRHSPLAPLGQVDEWTAKFSRFSIQVVRRSFHELCRLKHKKFRIADRQRGSNFPRREGEENQYTKRKTESYVFSGFGVGISFGWEWKSTTERFAIGRFWPFTWKTSSVGKEKSQ